MRQDDADRARRAEKVWRFDGSQPYDSPIVYWTRRVQRRLDALTPWSQFGYRCTRKLSERDHKPTWMYTLPGRRRARYYAEDYYLLLTTGAVTLWAFLTTGLTQPSSWQHPAVAWILLVPGLLLLALYTWASDNRRLVASFWALYLVTAVACSAIVGLGGWIRWFVPWPLVMRAIEIVLVLIRIISFDTLTGGYMHTPVSRVKYIYWVALCVVQVCFIYTAIYAFWVPHGFYDSSHCASTISAKCPPLTGLNNYIYLSVMTLTTLGSGFPPRGGLAQWLQKSEVAIGILLLAVGLATFVGSLQLMSLGGERRPGTYQQ